MMPFIAYLIVMGGVAYLIRVIPLLFVRKTITNPFIRSFLYYIPNSILAAMTIPAIFYVTDNRLAAVAGFAVAMLLAYKRKSLVTVAAGACVSVLAVELLMKII
ncbi:MAG: AzlD domain-containing protein [Erysipelotrichaceae bacterium]|nr:AzlD domain-containing protein [Erysipelotrichaceae bacterium]